MSIVGGIWESRVHPREDAPKWWRELFGAPETATGIEVDEETAMQYMAVFACVRVLAEDVASLPLFVYRRLQPRGKQHATDHFLYRLLHDQPNPEITSLQWRETMQVHLALWGNAYSEIEVNRNGRPLYLWPLTPKRVRVERPRPGQPVVYKVRLPKGGGERTLPAERVFHIAGMSMNGLIGLSPIAMAREAVGLGMATEEFGARFFGNNARPGAVLEHPGSLSTDAHDRLKASWDERHRGLEMAHRVDILEEGMKLHEVGIPPEDAQFLETRKFQVVEIARLYRMQPHKIGSMDAATFTNIEHQNIEHVVDTVRPWLVRWEQAIQQQLMPERDQANFFAEFLVDGLLRGDTQSRFQAFATARQWGWMSADDIRELENMNPLPEGRGASYLVPLNMMPAPAASGTNRSRSPWRPVARRGSRVRRVESGSVSRPS